MGAGYFIRDEFSVNSGDRALARGVNFCEPDEIRRLQFLGKGVDKIPGARV